MKLTVLVDNHTYIDRYYLGEPAVCYLIEDGEHVILLDTGYSDVFIENAARMGIDLARVTDIVLSHGHNDHTGGLPAFFTRFPQRVRLFAHPNALLPKRVDVLNVGCPLSLEALREHADVRLVTKPHAVSEHVTILGEIPRVYAFEADRAVGETLGACGCCWEEDGLADDTSLALTLQDGVFVVTGCAHAASATPSPTQDRFRSDRAYSACSAGFTCLRRIRRWARRFAPCANLAQSGCIPRIAQASRSRARCFPRWKRTKSASG